jgi:pimeloyl-ACP methyl ester carboxylesterase
MIDQQELPGRPSNLPRSGRAATPETNTGRTPSHEPPHRTHRQPASTIQRRGVRWSPASGTLLPGGLAVRTLGTAGPPVVLLHGLPSSGRFWGAEYDTLATHARLVVPDLLGFGRSPRPTGGYGPDDHADAVAATMHRLHVDDEPALVVGHSVGALVAIRLAVRHPSLVAEIVGFGAPIYRDYSSARHHLAHLGPLSRLFGLDTRWAELACTWLCQRHRRTAARLAGHFRPDLPQALAADAVEHSWESFSETLTRVVLAAEAPTWLDQIETPLHLIVGNQDPLVDIPFLNELSHAHPRLHLDVRAGTGHDLPLTDPSACGRAIERHLTAGSSRPAARP